MGSISTIIIPMRIETGFDIKDEGADNYIKFENPKEAITLNFSSDGSRIIQSLLILKGLSGHVGVREVISFMDLEGSISLKIVFDKYDEKGWRDKMVEVDLGEDQEAAISFWNLISEQPDLGGPSN